jgi:hypothetical protein
MASKINVMSQKEEMLEKGGPETQPDRALLDLSAAAVNELIRNTKKRGYVSHDQMDALLSSEEVKPKQIEDILANFSEAGVNVVDTKEAELEEVVATGEEPEKEAEGENELVEVQQRSVPAKSGAKNPAERTDDPVRMYFREMSSVELLSREGEIAIGPPAELSAAGVYLTNMRCGISAKVTPRHKGFVARSTPLAPTLHSWRVFNPDLEVDHQRIPITSERSPLGVESRIVRCEARTRRRAKKLDPRFLKLGSLAAIGSRSDPAGCGPGDRPLGPIRLNHVGSWKLVAAGSMT